MNTALGRGAYARRHYNVWRNGAPREALKPGKESHVRARGGGAGEGGWGGWCKWGNATENKPRESKPGQLLRAWTSLPNRGAIFSKTRFYLLEHFSVNSAAPKNRGAYLISRRTKLGVGQGEIWNAYESWRSLERCGEFNLFEFNGTVRPELSFGRVSSG